MMDLFKKSMVVCAAIGTFGSGAYTVYSGIDANFVQKVKAINAADLAGQLPIEEISTPQKAKSVK